MKKKLIKKFILTLSISVLFVFTVPASPTVDEQPAKLIFPQDFDPLVDLEVTVEIQAIRSLQKFEYPNPKTSGKRCHYTLKLYPTLLIDQNSYSSLEQLHSHPT